HFTRMLFRPRRKRAQRRIVRAASCILLRGRTVRDCQPVECEQDEFPTFARPVLFSMVAAGGPRSQMEGTAGGAAELDAQRIRASLSLGRLRSCRRLDLKRRTEYAGHQDYNRHTFGSAGVIYTDVDRLTVFGCKYSGNRKRAEGSDASRLPGERDQCQRRKRI